MCVCVCVCVCVCRNVPSMHDLYLSLLPEGGVASTHPGGHTASLDDPARVCDGCSLTASYGRNRLLVSYPPLLAQQYPTHVTNITLYGRLVNNEHVININPSLYHDDQVWVVFAVCVTRAVLFKLPLLCRPLRIVSPSCEGTWWSLTSGIPAHTRYM